MKRLSALSLGLVALTASVAIASEIPLFKNPSTAWAKEATAQQPQKKSQVALELSAQKQVVARDAQGKTKVVWQPLTKNNTAVRPGDILRYIVTSKNISDRAIQNLAIVQPIPQGTIYIPNSARMGQGNNVRVTYSINGGKSFVSNPTIRVKLANGQTQTRPAPPAAYTHVRWVFSESLKPAVAFNASYQVRVR